MPPETKNQTSANQKRRLIMTSGFRQYYAGYPVAKFRRYVIRRRVIFINALEDTVNIRACFHFQYETRICACVQPSFFIQSMIISALRQQPEKFFSAFILVRIICLNIGNDG